MSAASGCRWQPLPPGSPRSRLPASKPTAGCCGNNRPTVGRGSPNVCPTRLPCLVTRLRIFYDEKHVSAEAAFSVLLRELGDFPIMRRMFGIKQRAQSKAQTHTDLFALDTAGAQ
jgi:hypothetical protein